MNGPAGIVVSCPNRHIHYGNAGLKEGLATDRVIHPGFSQFPPGLVSLEIEPVFVKGHSHVSVLGPGIVGIDVENKPVYAHGVLKVLLGLEHAGILVPAYAGFRKRLCTNH